MMSWPSLLSTVSRDSSTCSMTASAHKAKPLILHSVRDRVKEKLI